MTSASPVASRPPNQASGSVEGTDRRLGGRDQLAAASRRPRRSGPRRCGPASIVGHVLADPGEHRGAGRPRATASAARKSSACEAARISTARTARTLATTSRSLRIDVQPIETWSSWLPEVGMVSTLAGCASTLFSLTSDAAVYCAIISPELVPGSLARNAGRSRENAGSSIRSVRRSAMLASSETAIASMSPAKASGSPWKLPVDMTSPSGTITGLSTIEPSSMSITRRACASTSRTAPCTCGAQRRQ